MFSASEEKWFCFRGNGRFLVHFGEKKPVIVTYQTWKDQPEAVLIVTDIQSLEDNYDGKKGHFRLVIKGGEGIHFKCDSAPEKDKWVASIRGLMEIYKGVKVVDLEDTRVSHKEEIDIRILAIIMDEQEGKLS